jgi:Flp pilus assembly protein TadG
MNAHPTHIRPSCERGSVLVSGLLFSLALLLVIGVAVDLGRAFIAKRELATLADDAALTGSQALDLRAVHAGRLALDPADARHTALRTLATEPGVRGQASAGPDTVTVTVRRRIPTVLLRLAGTSALSISARATATPRAP